MGFFTTLGRHKTLSFLVVVLVLAVIILVQNRDLVQFRVFFWKVSAHKVLFIAAVMVFGYLLGKLVELTVRKTR
ncbi:MAG: hypothetical protein ACE5LV_09210 [Candidatus Aminicenantales bacterium]